MNPRKEVPLSFLLITVLFGQLTRTVWAQGPSLSDRAFLMIQEGYLAHRNGDLAMAESKFRTVLNLPDNDSLTEVRATAGFALGTTLLEQERRKEAIEVFTSVINMRNAPQKLKDLCRQATDKARDASFQPKPLASETSDIRKEMELLLNQGVLLIDKGDSKVAEATFRTVFQFDRKGIGDLQAVAGYGLAVIMSKSDRKKEAIEVLDKVLGIPDAPEKTKADARRLKTKLTQ